MSEAAKLCSLLKEVIEDETEAPKEYAEVMEAIQDYRDGLPPSISLSEEESLRNDWELVRHIREDEGRHKVTLEEIYRRRCSR